MSNSLESSCISPPNLSDTKIDTACPPGSSRGDSVGDVVIVAVDGSKQSDAAFEWYIEHLHKKTNSVLLVFGLEIPAMPTRESWDHQMQNGVSKRQEMQDKFQQKFKDLGIQGKFISDFEKPGELIVTVATREKADYIVIGTRGLGKLCRTIMGSVSDYVVHHAHCPVVVSRNA